PLCRWDIESEFYNTKKNKLKKIYLECLKDFNSLDIKVVVLSDYNKGFWNLNLPISEWMKNKISIVDPKKNPVEKWKGCTIFKPNSKEAELISGYSNWKKQVDFFEKKINCRAVLITD